MAWFELHQSLVAHPKTKRMARMLDISSPQAVGHCVCLWAWAMDYAQDGVLTEHGNEGIADAAQWTGDSDAFVSAMTECGVGGKPGFLEWIDGNLVIHDWWEYAGKYIAKKEREKLRQRVRRGSETASQRTGNVPSMLPQHTDDVHHALLLDKIDKKDKIEEIDKYANTTTTDTDFRSAMVKQYEAVLGMVPTASYSEMTEYMDKLQDRGVPEWWGWAITETVGNAKRPSWQYMKSVLVSWLAAGVASVDKRERSNGTGTASKLEPGEIQVSRRQSDDGTEWIYFDIANGREAYRQPRSESDLLF